MQITFNRLTKIEFKDSQKGIVEEVTEYTLLDLDMILSVEEIITSSFKNKDDKCYIHFKNDFGIVVLGSRNQIVREIIDARSKERLGINEQY